MPIYCDESGGLNAGVMTFAAVQIDADAADAVLDRFCQITGLRGELKGSRITIAERGLLIELMMQHGGRAWIAEARSATIGPLDTLGAEVRDITLYARLLQTAVKAWLPESGGDCLHVIIDEGRYDPHILSIVEADIETLLSGWGQASLTDSKRCAGVQIADVIANSFFNIGAAANLPDPRADRIQAIVAPYLADKRLREIEVTSV